MKNQIKITIKSSAVEKSRHLKGLYNKKYRLELSYNDKKYLFTYHDSINNYLKNIKLDKKMALYSLFMDVMAYESTMNENDFIDEFGYSNISEGKRAFDNCKKASEVIHEMFTDSEIGKLYQEFTEY